MRSHRVLPRPLRAVAAASALALVPASAALGASASASLSASAAASVTATSTAPVWYRHGSSGIGDPSYPTYGNGGYDVTSYDIRIGYTPRTDHLTGVTTIRAKATQNLSSFHLDLALKASRVSVDGRAARFSKKGRELTVTPAKHVRKGKSMKVVVTYAGTPSKVKVDGLAPWVRTKDGAVAVGEPEIAAWWFPSNDHPRDKAAYDIRVTVPKWVEVLSNGKKVSKKRTSSSRDTWHWSEHKPMASYLAFMAVGQFDVTSTSAWIRTSSKALSKLPVVTAVASNGGYAGAYAKRDMKRTPEIVRWLTTQWGPYPFDAIGGVAPHAEFGFALENQTRPVYTREFWDGGSNIYVIVHEQAHQWFGDSVSVHRWRDIWLNEGFATFTEWRWAEQHHAGTAQQIFDQTYAGYPASDPFWDLAIGHPRKGHEFDPAVYDRGAMTLQALRNRIGNTAFFALMRGWASAHKYRTATVGQFTALAEKVSHQQLDGFFKAWLETGSKPARTVANGFPAAVSAKSVSATSVSPSAAGGGTDQVRATMRQMAQVHAVSARQNAR